VFIGIVFEIVPALHLGRYGLTQRWRAPGDRVLIGSRIEGTMSCFNDFARRVKIGKTLSEIDRLAR
jgi:hypothetical protein